MKQAVKATAKAKPSGAKKKVPKGIASVKETSTGVAAASPVLSGQKGIGAGDEIVVDLSTACTKDVAVVKLLGWMRGPIRRKYVEVAENGIAIDQMSYLHTLEGSLADQLNEFRAAAHGRLFDAFEANATDDVMDDLDKEVKRCDELIYMAAQYMRDIEDELGKDQGSALKIDQLATQQARAVHVTLSSLDRWSRAKYHIGVVEDYSGLYSKAPKDASKPEPATVNTFDEVNLNRGLESAYASFGFLMASYVVKSKGHMYGGEVNSDMIAETVVAEIMKGTQQDLYGQSVESMRKTFSRAVTAMKSKLRECKTTQIDYLTAVEK